MSSVVSESQSANQQVQQATEKVIKVGDVVRGIFRSSGKEFKAEVLTIPADKSSKKVKFKYLEDYGNAKSTKAGMKDNLWYSNLWKDGEERPDISTMRFKSKSTGGSKKARKKSSPIPKNLSYAKFCENVLDCKLEFNRDCPYNVMKKLAEVNNFINEYDKYMVNDENGFYMDINKYMEEQQSIREEQEKEQARLREIEKKKRERKSLALKKFMEEQMKKFQESYVDEDKPLEETIIVESSEEECEECDISTEEMEEVIAEENSNQDKLEQFTNKELKSLANKNGFSVKGNKDKMIKSILEWIDNSVVEFKW